MMLQRAPSMIERTSEIERLRDRVAELEELLGLDGPSVARFLFVRVSPRPRLLLSFLMTQKFVTRDAALTAIYDQHEDDRPGIKIIDVFVCKLRRALKPHGVAIEGVWGSGYRLSPLMKQRLLDVEARHEAVS